MISKGTATTIKPVDDIFVGFDLVIIKELAHMTMVNQLAQADLGVNHDFQVLDTSPDTATPLTSI